MKKLSKSYAMLAVIYLAGIAAPLNQFKVPPVMKQLMQSLDISLAASGWLMSVFALVGFIGAIPVGLLLKKLNTRTVGLTGLALLLMGSLLGGLSSSDKINSRKKILVTGCVIMCFSAAVPFLARGAAVAAGLFIIGIAFGHILGIILAAAPEVMGRQDAAAGLSAISFGQYLGMSAGPMFFSFAAGAFGWSTAGMLLIPVAVLSYISALLVKMR